MNQDLIQKLMLSKKIMDKHSEMPRSGANSGFGTNYDYNEDSKQISRESVQEFQPMSANYNIPQEFLGEQSIPQKSFNTSEPSKDMVMSSKLPDEIKRLMMEHPIQKPQQTSVTISEDVIAAAARLMNTKANGEQVIPKQNSKVTYKENIQETNNPNFKSLVKEAVKEILQESGLLIESSKNTNELFSFRVGQHIFEGKVTKIKKVR
jgi:rubrerythrin